MIVVAHSHWDLLLGDHQMAWVSLESSRCNNFPFTRSWAPHAQACRRTTGPVAPSLHPHPRVRASMCAKRRPIPILSYSAPHIARFPLNHPTLAADPPPDDTIHQESHQIIEKADIYCPCPLARLCCLLTPPLPLLPLFGIRQDALANLATASLCLPRFGYLFGLAFPRRRMLGPII